MKTMPASLSTMIVHRMVPQELLGKVYAGIAEVYGGTVREVKTGRILAELVEVGTSASGNPLGAAASVAETASRRIIGIATASTALSGLTLAVSTAGFLFLTKRLSSIDARLQEIQKVRLGQNMHLHRLQNMLSFRSIIIIQHAKMLIQNRP